MLPTPFLRWEAVEGADNGGLRWGGSHGLPVIWGVLPAACAALFPAAAFPAPAGVAPLSPILLFQGARRAYPLRHHQSVRLLQTNATFLLSSCVPAQRRARC